MALALVEVGGVERQGRAVVEPAEGTGRPFQVDGHVLERLVADLEGTLDVLARLAAE